MLLISLLRYLNHLAVSDLLYLLFNVPFCLEDFVRVSVSGEAAGRSSAVYYAYVGVPLVNLFLTMSEYIVVWLSYDRCLAVCWPHKFSAKQRLRVVRERCGLSLVLTMAVYCLSPLSQTYQCEGAVCCVIDSHYSHLGWFMAYELFREIYSRFLPALLVTGFNVAIVVTLRRLHRERGAEDVINESRQERERRLFVLLVAVTVLFYVTAFPSAMYKVLPGADPRLESVLRPIADMLEVSGHVFNFVLYFLFSPDYRRTLVGMAAPPDKSRAGPAHFHSSSAIPL